MSEGTRDVASEVLEVITRAKDNCLDRIRESSNKATVRTSSPLLLGTTKELPINTRLRNKSMLLNRPLKLTPRRYQEELYRKAMHENVIIYLGTGLGKTYITILYLNSPEMDNEITENKRKVVFLAPTQDLIMQQAEYINMQVRYNVKVFCGRSCNCGEHIDKWDKPTWDSELEKVDLLFMTPQIFASAINTNLLNFCQFSAIIFDELHHACRSKTKESGHPYMQILKHYGRYFQLRPNENIYLRPRLIGLTASLINSMPKNRDSIRNEIHYLEKVLSARCITDLDVQDIKPHMVIHKYSCFMLTPCNDPLTSIFEKIKLRFDEALKTENAMKIHSRNTKYLTKDQVKLLAFHNKLRLAALGFSIKPASFSKVFRGLLMIRQRCGFWALRAVCNKLIVAVEKHGNIHGIGANLKPVYNHFAEMLKKISVTLDKSLNLPIEEELFLHTRPKLKALLDILEYEYIRTKDGTNGKSSFSCIIFVRSRLEVVALNEWIQKVSISIQRYNFIKCDYAIGIAATMSSKYSCITKRKAADQTKMLNDFRKNILNIVVTTSVLEEGIDLPVCSTVIRYDISNNFREYVQSRGRARQKISSFISMCQAELERETTDKMDKFNDFEFTLRETLQDKNIGPIVRDSSHPKQILINNEKEEEDFFIARENSICISASTAKTILNMYCTRLSKSTPYAEGVRYDRNQPTPDTYRTVLYLPSGCPLNENIIGNIKSSVKLADNSAVVAAIKALYEEGELNEHGVPTRASEKNIDKILSTQNLEPKFDKLDKTLEGISVVFNDKEINLFEPKLFNVGDHLSKDIINRTYKLLRIRYVPSSKIRIDTCEYFEKSIFGIIVDSSTSNEFIPPLLNSHYGQFKVEYDLLSDNLLIKNPRDHDVYLRYTFNLILRYLSIRPINKDDFKTHCLFYIVPLFTNNKPNLYKMRNSFYEKSDILRKNDVVKLRSLNSQPQQRNNKYGRQQKDYFNENRLMIVRRICDDMTPNSMIPGQRSRETFISHAEYRYGRRIKIHPNQRVVEVMPLSKEFARIKEGKKIVEGYSTPSLFYLEQFLEYFDNDPAYVLQALNKPEIIYRLYLNSSIVDLSRKFRCATRNKRHDNVINDSIKLATTPTELILENNLGEQSQQHDQSDSELDVVDKQVAAQDGHEEDDGSNQSSDEDEADSDANTLDSNDTDYTDDELMIGPQYEDMIAKRSLNLFDHGSDENMERWDMSEYKVSNLKTQTYEYRRSEAGLEHSLSCSSILTLEVEILNIQHKIIDSLQHFEMVVTGDDWFLDQDSEFKKRTAKVDHTIIPPIHFDRNTKPVKEASLEQSILEALTQRRAQEFYNLEGLENIGDSYLKYLVSLVLFKSLEGNEGILTSARSRLTCNKYFTYLAKKSALGTYVINRAFSRDIMPYMFGKQVRDCKEMNKVYNRMRQKDLADTFESIVGSYLIYHGQYEAILAIEWLGLRIFNETIFDELHENAVVFSKTPSALIETYKAEERDLYGLFKKKVHKFESIIGYTFNDASFLIQAFTHASSITKCTRSYERLEFLGDSILDYLITMSLVTTGSINDPGQLTTSRSALVNNCAFAMLAMKYQFDLFIQHCNHELYDELTKVRLSMEDDPEMTFLDMTDFDNIVKLLGDVFESVAGAIYLDSGCSLDTVWSVYYPMMKECIDQEIKVPTKNLVAKLYETFSGNGRITFESYDLKTADGDMIGVRCCVKGFGEFEGQGLTKRQAKQRAVREAMKNAPSDAHKARLDRDYQSSLLGLGSRRFRA